MKNVDNNIIPNMILKLFKTLNKIYFVFCYSKRNNCLDLDYLSYIKISNDIIFKIFRLF